jgi:phosphohistidine phosphatase
VEQVACVRQTAAVHLWLLRHAKSSWSDQDLPDEDRPLAPRGLRAADRMREHLDANGVRPELVLCSSALRARQTFARVLPALGTELEIRIEPGLYTFEAEILLDRLRRVPPSVGSLLLVGHNPAMQDLAARLADRGEGLHELSRKYPTGGLAEIDLVGSTWDTITERPGELVRFVNPRELDAPPMASG